MKRFFYLVAIFCLLSCNNSSDQQAERQDTVQTSAPDSLIVWNVDAEANTMTRIAGLDTSDITVASVINGLNSKYPRVRIVFLSQGHDTVFTEVPDANYLGEQMGSAGSSAWYADAVINLTAVPGVNYVSFKMDPHSHAQSAIVGKNIYESWKKQ